MRNLFAKTLVALAAFASAGWAAAAAPTVLSVANYSSIQEALDKNPGQMLYVPPGDYEIAEAIKITADNAGLYGPGRIIQNNPQAMAIHLKRAANVRLRDLTLTRPAGKRDAPVNALEALQCTNLVLEGLQVIDSPSRSSVIRLVDCVRLEVRGCLIQNYMCVSLEDRMGRATLGYAFNSIDGTGIDVVAGQGALLQGNRIVELNLLPTPEIKEKFKLGSFTRKAEQKGQLLSQAVWDEEYTDAWHQGAAIHLGSPETGDGIQVVDNYIENAAQGLDIQSDHVIVARNIFHNVAAGLKATHGSRNVSITGNQFVKNCLWAIGVMPGTSAHAAQPAAGNKKAVPANVTAGIVIAHNIISDFGHGQARWIWQKHACYPIRLGKGKLDNPPVSDVLIQGNLLYDTGRDQVIVDGQPKIEPPRYEYAIFVETGKGAPEGVHCANNLLHPGTAGLSNVELKP